METHILLIDCVDRKGIVHKVTGALYRSGLNIDDQGEFVDKTSDRFFMRTEVSGSFDPGALLSEIRRAAPEGAQIHLNPSEKKSIVVLGTKEWHCIGDLLMRHHYGDLNADIQAVICNHNDLRELTEKFDIPFRCIPHQGISREDHEANILEALSEFSPDYIVLAKYMRCT